MLLTLGERRLRNKRCHGLVGGAPCLDCSGLHHVKRAQGQMQKTQQTEEGSCKCGGSCVTAHTWEVCKAPPGFGKGHGVTLQRCSCCCQRGLASFMPLAGRHWEVFSYSLPLCSSFDQHSSGNCGCSGRGCRKVCLCSGVIPRAGDYMDTQQHSHQVGGRPSHLQHFLPKMPMLSLVIKEMSANTKMGLWRERG